MDQSLYLIGFMGSGKTTVGRLLATRLRLDFYDLDEVVERREGRDIPTIFRESGEPFFRQCEHEALTTLPGPALIAPGGGAFLNPEIRAHIRRTGISVFIDWPFRILLARVSGDKGRPLAQDPVRLEALFKQRYPIYRFADLTWSSRPPHDESPERVTGEILSMLRDPR